MFGLLALLFIVIPAVEIGIIVKIGQWLGLLPTLAVIVGTAVVGAYLAKKQGLHDTSDA